MKNWTDSPVMTELRAAVQSGDFSRQMAILDSQIEHEAGADRAYWLTQRAALRARRLYPVLDAAWADLEAALAIAPEEVTITEKALLNALNFSLRTERFDHLRRLLPAVRPHLRGLLRNNQVQCCVADLQLRRGRWRAALRCYNRCAAGMEAYGPERRSQHQEFFPSLYARRAVVAFKAGEHRLGEQDVERAFALAARLPAARRDHLILALAKAEEAFQQRCFQASRHAIQEGLLRAGGLEQASRNTPDLVVEAELLAARMARAEGQPVGLTYFCDRALQVIGYRDLPLTVAHIEAVRRGSD